MRRQNELRQGGMNSQSNQMPTPPPEPRASRRAVPVWLVILLFALLYWAMIYFDQRSGWADARVYLPYHSLAELDLYQPPPSTGLGAAMLRGKPIFEGNCALCHGPDGMGKPGQAPPMVGSEWVMGPPNRLVRIPQDGLAGPIHVKGEVWNQAPQMAPMGAGLSDADLAAVLSYIRNSWGNKAPEVTPEQVHAVRTHPDVAKRTQPWSEQELNAVE
jgi:mono/diheme cytochrome c family protein